MALQKNRVVNSNRAWDAGRVYKVNEVVQIAGVVYQNLTGSNSDPSLLVDWVVVYQELGVIYTQAEVDALLADKMDKNSTGFANYADSGYTSGAPFAVSATTDTVLPNRAQVIYDDQIPADIKTFYYSRRLIIGSIVGTYVEGETVTGGTSGATGTLKEINSDGDLLLVNQSGTWSVSETVTGGTSGATSTLTTIKQGAITGRNGDGLDIMLYFYAVPTNVSQTMDVWLDLTDGVGTPANLARLYAETYSFPKGVGIERGIKINFSSAYNRDTWEANGGRIWINSSHALTIYGINFNFDRSHKAR